MQGLVTVFGGTGFVGHQVVRALAKRGYRVRAAARNEGAGYRLRMLGDVGQIEVVQANVRNRASVERALDGAQACINLVAVLYESGRQRFQDLHVEGARTIAECAAARGINRFVQVSAIGADANSDSKYARSKAQGEAAVREAVPSAAIIRPSIVFGPEDAFFNRFGQMAALSPVLPMVGAQTRFQPVFVADLGAAIANAATDASAAGQTFEVGGPAVYTFRELMEIVKRETGRKSVLLPVSFPIARLIGMAGDIQARLMAPVLTSDQVEMLRHDNVPAEGMPGLRELGVTPTRVEAVVPTYLYRYRKGGQYADLPAPMAG
ncbi:MAG TPA: complex I NDUFA9 subunit family protein [Caulobacteraceae bacterium]|nr:complex I NDUFA9 subunit family protein [Caulobacteraceae bacterium]